MNNFFGRTLSTVLGNLLTFVLIFVFLGIFIGVISAIGSLSGDDEVDDASVLQLTFDEAIAESSMQIQPNPFELEPKPKSYYLDYMNALDKAAEDDRIKGISLKVNGFSGDMTHLVKIGEKLNNLKEKGKFIYAYTSNASQGGYYLASFADSIYQNPLGIIDLKGLSANVMFFKNFGEKYGVDFQVIRHGEYKSAVEPYIRENLSDENREQLGAIITDIWGQMSKDIVKNRKFGNTTFQSGVDSLIGFLPEKLLEKKYIDVIADETKYDRLIAKKLKLDLDKEDDFYEEFKDHIVGLNFYTSKQKLPKGSDKIAILYAAGMINTGDGYEGIQSEFYKKQIRKLRFDDKVKAVVLRINSGGGSAEASEDMLVELRKLKAEKPLVVSFGDVAASGGYYMAMESDSIISNAQTITGSIGVLGMIPNIKKMGENIGLNVDYVNTNENSHTLQSMFVPMTATAQNQLKNSVEKVYERFVNHVAKARNMTFEQVDQIARGRVWTGNQALELGLVDSLGDLQDAIAAAAKLAGLEEYGIKEGPVRKEGLEEFLEQYNVQSTQAVLKNELGQETYKVFEELRQLQSYKGVQMRMPFAVDLDY